MLNVIENRKFAFINLESCTPQTKESVSSYVKLFKNFPIFCCHKKLDFFASFTIVLICLLSVFVEKLKTEELMNHNCQVQRST